ncbi:MAG: peptidoglycan-binding protein [Cytophagia bacterium]|nr:peptidoglycan-binding protein [Cytophagia bacterium]
MAWLGKYSEGDRVRDVQGLLWQAGVYDGKIDGYFGPKTEDAVRRWQSEIGALPDGFWGARTIEASSKYLAGLNDISALDAGASPVVPRVEMKGMG